MSYYNIGELIDIKPEAGGTFIHSLSEPFNEEMLIDYKKLYNWLEHFRMSLTQSHASGHATGDELKRIVQDIDADALFPIHTEHAELFDNMFRQTITVQPGKTYPLTG